MEDDTTRAKRTDMVIDAIRSDSTSSFRVPQNHTEAAPNRRAKSQMVDILTEGKIRKLSIKKYIAPSRIGAKNQLV